MVRFSIGVGFIGGLTPGASDAKAVMDGRNVVEKTLPSIIPQCLFTAGFFLC